MLAQDIDYFAMVQVPSSSGFHIMTMKDYYESNMKGGKIVFIPKK